MIQSVQPLPLKAHEVAYARAWRSFQGLDRVADHRADWAAWVAGRDPHLLLLVPVREPAARRAVARLQRHLASVPGVEVHPARFLHVTVQSLGFLAPAGASPRLGEIEPSALAALLPQLAAHIGQVPQFNLCLGGLNAFHSCAFLEVRPTDQLLALRAAIRTAGGSVIRGLDPFEDYLFHLTAGFFGPHTTLPMLRDKVAALRRARAGRVRVDEVQLVALPTQGRTLYPPLVPLASFPLRAGMGSG